MYSDALFRYLSPSLLSSSELREEITRNSFKIKGLEKKSHDDLMHIFITNLMPLPQRTFPNNHHGKLINQMIRNEDFVSRKNSKKGVIKSNISYGFKHDKEGGKLPSISQERKSSASVSCDRLKPPIDSSDIQSKKICLTRSCSSSSTSPSNIVGRRKACETSISDSDNKNKIDETEQACHNAVSLKRVHNISEKVNKDEQPCKKARQRIAWP